MNTLKSYKFNQSVLIAVTLSDLPLNTYSINPTMLPLLEMFPEPMLWNTFQCLRHTLSMSLIFWNLRYLKAVFIFGNSWDSF